MLYAQDRWAVLLIFQAMDAAGKDGAIKHVMSGVNPQGCQVYSFKAPSSEELDHDFLWRCTKSLPERGRIGIFNRSYYEEMLVVRVHPEMLAAQKLPPELVTKHIWDERFEDIRDLRALLARNGMAVCKFFLHVSKQEQKKRFLERLETRRRTGSSPPDDAKERAHWDDYMAAYEDMIRNTATKEAPWYVVPADNKWFTRVVVCGGRHRDARGARPAYPKVERGEAQGAGGGPPGAAPVVSVSPSAARRQDHRTIAARIASSPCSLARHVPAALAGRRPGRRASRWPPTRSRCRSPMPGWRACHRRPASTATCWAASATRCSARRGSSRSGRRRRSRSWSASTRRADGGRRSRRATREIATLAAFLVAVLAGLAWVLRLSALTSFISETILVGFKAGAALTIAMTQLPALLGVPGGGDGFFTRLAVIAGQLGPSIPSRWPFGLAAIALLLAGERFLPGRPVALLVVALAIGAVSLTSLDRLGLALVGRLPGGLPAFGLPALRPRDVDGIVPLAAACLLLGVHRGRVGGARLRRASTATRSTCARSCSASAPPTCWWRSAAAIRWPAACRSRR